jgi:chemotaxis signal transduction protein
MNGAERGFLASADELRRAFDIAFAQPSAGRGDSAEAFLALRVGSDAYAVRVREIAGFAAARKVVPLSSPIPEMLGLASIRGGLVPVYGLAALLGYGDRDGPPRWFLLCGGADSLALAFADFDGYLELPRPDLRAIREGEIDGGHVREVLRMGAEVRSVIGVASLMGAIEEKVAGAFAMKEP